MTAARIRNSMLVVLLAAAWTARGVAQPGTPPARAATTTPNIVLILTDDQRFDSLVAMPNVRRLMGSGVTFANAFVSNSVCCPSRATILTGSYSHTNRVWTNVYSQDSPYGAFQAFRAAGDEQGTIAKALHDAGYFTGLVGKYFNSYDGAHLPAGWDRFSAFAHTANGGQYYDYDMWVHDAHGDRYERYGSTSADYSTTVIQHKALEFIRNAPQGRPFFLYAATYAPHGRLRPAPRDVGTFAGQSVSLPRSLNEADVSDKPPYIRSVEHMLPAATAQDRLRSQWETLQAVDRMVGAITRELSRSGRLNSTAIVFMSDNGIAVGEHRWTYKLTPYDESIRIPLVVRYSPMTARRAGAVSNALVSNVDIAPTFAELAGIPFHGVGKVEGVSLAPLLSGSASSVRSSLLLEHLDYPTAHHVPTYCGLRTPGWTYVRYSSGFEELYNQRSDPDELNNLVGTGKAPSVLRDLRSRTRVLCDPPPPGYGWP